MNNNDPNIFDLKATLEFLDGDHNILKKIIAAFLNDCNKLFPELQNGIAENDAKTIERTAHTIKGGALNFGAKKLAETARSLENIGESKDLTEAKEILPQLEKEFAEFKQAIEKIK